ncbi:hypothetical protein QR680_003626 [Steinernema hermaphroditum]|uniref:Uncharacterized protein n=1 Tax=Steinernema hermaphroditum TaxID=289476 RepID=A0AA39LSE2_9BILA|nr:hypothetical protein QR680_003626 [Steinernema hermaphroditum]
MSHMEASQPLTRPPPSAPSPPPKNSKKMKNKITKALVIVIAIVVVSIGAWALCTDVFIKKISRPGLIEAYLVKSLSFHEGHMSDFNYNLGRWLLGEDVSWGSSPTPPVWASVHLGKIVDEAENFQKIFSESTNENYRNEQALHEVHFAYTQNKTRIQIDQTIRRYIKSLNIDRTFRLEKFLVSYIAYPDEDAEVQLNSSLGPFEDQIAIFKSTLPEKYHEGIDGYWRSLKRHTIPGIWEGCVPRVYNTSYIVREYMKSTRFRVTKCVPHGEPRRAEINTDLLVAVLTVVFALLWFGFLSCILCGYVQV